ncbi:MAG: hypothetical protein M1819_006341 [Sarea resinae]|nr:MAG: hypothetical protein M1819_006341 [Sarea resinae]
MFSFFQRKPSQSASSETSAPLESPASQQAERPPPPPPPTTTPILTTTTTTTTTTNSPQTADFTTAPSAPASTTTTPSNRPLSLFLGGIAFFALSTLITRRSLHRRRLATKPAFYHPNSHQPTDVNGAIEAFEALNIATINVFSFAMMGVGGLCWKFDIGSLEDLKRRVRGGLGVDGSGKSEQEAEEEIEEWLVSVLARKDDKEKKRGEGEQVRTNERGASR